MRELKDGNCGGMSRKRRRQYANTVKALKIFALVFRTMCRITWVVVLICIKWQSVGECRYCFNCIEWWRVEWRSFTRCAPTPAAARNLLAIRTICDGRRRLDGGAFSRRQPSGARIWCAQRPTRRARHVSGVWRRKVCRECGVRRAHRHSVHLHVSIGSDAHRSVVRAHNRRVRVARVRPPRRDTGSGAELGAPARTERRASGARRQVRDSCWAASAGGRQRTRNSAACAHPTAGCPLRLRREARGKRAVAGGRCGPIQTWVHCDALSRCWRYRRRALALLRTSIAVVAPLLPRQSPRVRARCGCRGLGGTRVGYRRRAPRAAPRDPQRSRSSRYWQLLYSRVDRRAWRSGCVEHGTWNSNDLLDSLIKFSRF